MSKQVLIPIYYIEPARESQWKVGGALQAVGRLPIS